MIKSAKILDRKPVLDLRGPDGNAFTILAQAKRCAKDLGKDWIAIRNRMMASDYENLVKVFDQEFGNYVDIYR